MSRPLPDWAHWSVDPSRPAWTVGVEEEVMLLEPQGWTLVQAIDDLLPELSPALADKTSAETHACTIELETGVHATVGEAMAELGALRGALVEELRPLGLRAAAAGTHPLAMGEDTRVSQSARYQVLEEGLRELARREPTFALHVHVGVPFAELAMTAANRLRVLLPLVLALSANSPFWRARDTGLASMRSALFGAFPRSGMPRHFSGYAEYVETIDSLLRADAFPEPTFIWWDVRLQPRYGTVEVRIMDTQTRLRDTAAIVALIQSLVRVLATERLAPDALLDAREALDENRFIAMRDGMGARFVDPVAGVRMEAGAWLEEIVARCRPHARNLDCRAELESVLELAALSGAACQRDRASRMELSEVVAGLADEFVPPPLASEPSALEAPATS